MDAKRFARNTRAICWRELAGYFDSAVAYVFIVIFLVLVGFFTFSVSRLYDLGRADLSPFFQWHPWIFLFLVPAVAMRLWAEERRMGTMELLLTLPVTLGEAILGKFLAAWAFVTLALVLTFPVVLTVMYLGDPDLGAVFSAYVGSFLLGGAFLSVGSLTSAMTRSQVVSFILTVIICLFFLMAGWPPVTDFVSGWAPGWLLTIITGFSMMSHYLAMQKGVLTMSDVIYYLSLIFFMLYATGVVLQSRRAS